jgi:hypothetical protein
VEESESGRTLHHQVRTKDGHGGDSDLVKQTRWNGGMGWVKERMRSRWIAKGRERAAGSRRGRWNERVCARKRRGEVRGQFKDPMVSR